MWPVELPLNLKKKNVTDTFLWKLKYFLKMQMLFKFKIICQWSKTVERSLKVTLKYLENKKKYENLTWQFPIYQKSNL